MKKRKRQIADKPAESWRGMRVVPSIPGIFRFLEAIIKETHFVVVFHRHADAGRQQPRPHHAELKISSP